MSVTKQSPDPKSNNCFYLGFEMRHKSTNFLQRKEVVLSQSIQCFTNCSKIAPLRRIPRACGCISGVQHNQVCLFLQKKKHYFCNQDNACVNFSIDVKREETAAQSMVCKPGCMHSLFSFALTQAILLHNRFACGIKQVKTKEHPRHV